jgi:hypothetical protein
MRLRFGFEQSWKKAEKHVLARAGRRRAEGISHQFHIRNSEL